MANPVQKGKPTTPAKKVVKPISLSARAGIQKPVAKPAPKPSGFMNALSKVGKAAYTYSGAKDIVTGGQKIAQSGILPGGKKADWGQAALGLGQTALGAAGFIPGAGFATRAAVGGAKALSAGSKVLKATKAAQTVAKTPVSKAAVSAATRVGSPLAKAAKPVVTAVKKPLATAAKPLVKAESYLNKGLLKGTGKKSKVLNATVANKGALAILASQAIPSLVSGYNQAMAQPATKPAAQAPANPSLSIPAPIPSTPPNTYRPPNNQPPASANPPAQGMPPAANLPGATPEVPILETPIPEGNLPTFQNPIIDESIPTEENIITQDGIPTLQNPLTEQSTGETTMQSTPNAADYLMQSEDMQSQGEQGMNQGSGAFQSQGTPGGTGAAPLLGAAQVAGMNYNANLAQAAATANINDAGIREALSQRLMGAQDGAADIIGGRAAGILGQGITGARRSYVTEKSSEAQRALAEQDALRRQYGSELSEAYKAQAEKVLDAAKARSEAAAQIRRYGVA